MFPFDDVTMSIPTNWHQGDMSHSWDVLLIKKKIKLTLTIIRNFMTINSSKETIPDISGETNQEATETGNTMDEM